MLANIDHRSASWQPQWRQSYRVAGLSLVAFCLQVSALDTGYAQSHTTREQPKPIDIATACLARGDDHCVVRALEGKAKSAMELGLLIETYRALEETELARPAMEQYVQRFPDAQRAHAYRRMLETTPLSPTAQHATPNTSAQQPSPNTSAQNAPPSARAQSGPPDTNAPHALPNVQSRTASTSAQSAPPAEGARAASETRTPLAEANACRAASDDHCIVRALEGKAQTAEELGMLCEAYRELGDNKRARAAMQQYVDRFPQANFSAFYREQLSRAR